MSDDYVSLLYQGNLEPPSDLRITYIAYMLS